MVGIAATFSRLLEFYTRWLHAAVYMEIKLLPVVATTLHVSAHVYASNTFTIHNIEFPLFADNWSLSLTHNPHTLSGVTWTTQQTLYPMMSSTSQHWPCFLKLTTLNQMKPTPWWWRVLPTLATLLWNQQGGRIDERSLNPWSTHNCIVLSPLLG